MASEGHCIETERGRIYLELEGDAAAELVILAAGGPGISHDHYHPWFSRLSPEFRVAYLDYIGCGRSDRLDDPRAYSVELFAGNLEDLRRFVGAETVSVIGISFGGLPALEYALDHRVQVRRLVLSNAQVSAAGWQRGNIDGVNAELERLFPHEWQQLMELRAGGVLSLDPRYQDLVARILGDLEWFDPWGHPPLNRTAQGGGISLDVYEALVGDDPEWAVSGTLAGYDRSEDFHLLPPTLVLTGRYDRLTPPVIAYETYDRLDPDTRRLHVFERSAHRPWAEEPDEYFRVVKSFLTSDLSEAHEPPRVHVVGEIGDGAPALAPRLGADAFRDLAHRLARAWTSLDVDAALACFADDAVYMEPPDVQLFVARDQLRSYFRALTEGTQMTFQALWFDEERQLGAGEFSFGGDGLPTAVHGVAVMELRDGVIAFWREYHRRGASEFSAFLSTTGKEWEWSIVNYP